MRNDRFSYASFEAASILFAAFSIFWSKFDIVFSFHTLRRYVSAEKKKNNNTLRMNVMFENKTAFLKAILFTRLHLSVQSNFVPYRKFHHQ